MELALAALLLEAKTNDDNIRTKESLSLLEELQYKLKAYISKKCWICTDPEFIVELESYSRLAPEPETYLELLVALRHHSLLNNLDLFDNVVYASLQYDLSKTSEDLDTLNNIIDQATSRLSYLVNPEVEEEAIPEDYDEDHYEATDTTLLAKYILLGPVGTTGRLESEEEDEVDSISSSSSYSSPSSPLESRMGDESWVAWWEGWKASYSITSLESLTSPPPLKAVWAAWWEGWKASNVSSTYIPTEGASSPPPRQVAWSAWWEGWKASNHYTPIESVSSPPPPQANWTAWWEGWKASNISTYYTQTESVSSPPPLQASWTAWWEGWKSSPTPRTNPNPSHQVSILDAWWEGWKESVTPVQFSFSSLILLLYLLLLYYTLSDSLLCTEPMYDLSNPCLPFLRHSAITGSMGSWVKVPDQCSCIPKAPQWQSRWTPPVHGLHRTVL